MQGLKYIYKFDILEKTKEATMQDGPDQTNKSIGYVGATTLQAKAPDISPAEVAVDSQAKSIEYLHNNLDILFMKLEKIMTSPYDSPEKAGYLTEDPGQRSPFVSNIETNTTRVTQASRRIEDMIERLDV